MSNLDLIGNRFGQLVVLSEAEPRYSNAGKKRTRWNCVCDCGGLKEACQSLLRSGQLTSCGCKQVKKDLSGQKFGYLTVLYEGEPKAKPSGKSSRQWWCKCACGNMSLVFQDALCSGHTKSCGCLFKKRAAEANSTHGMTGSDEHRLWKNIKARCFRKSLPSYKNYGGRGITMEPEWIDDFQAFYDYVGPRPSKEHSLDRQNNNLGYVKGNLRWATAAEQAKNTRRNVYLEYNGERRILKEWSEIFGIGPATIRARIKLGWSVEEALATQPNSAPRKKRSKP